MQETSTQIDGALPICDKALSDPNSMEESLSMPLNSLSGTFYIALFVQAVALLLSLFEYFTNRTIQDWLVRN